MTPPSAPRVRFAPSPTGALHIGGIRTALWNWLLARRYGGQFILRIEDTDKTREVERGTETILETLKAYGLECDEGPGVGGDYGPYIQSERLDLYRTYAEQMIESGAAYYAYDTPEELQRHREQQQLRGLPTGYSRRHRDLPESERAIYERDRRELRVVRLAAPREGQTTFTDMVYGELSYENRVLDDAVLLKSDGYPTYHLANVVDDHLMRITHVLRGEDWIPSTPLHLLIYQALGWDPPAFVHLPNMLGPDGKKLSKRFMAVGAMDYLSGGYLREALINFLAMQGWSAKEDRDLYSVEELKEKFSLEGILNRSPIFDPDKLLWYNGQYIRALSADELTQRAIPFLSQAGLVDKDPEPTRREYIGRVLSLEQERMKTLADAPLLADFFLAGDDELIYDEAAVRKRLSVPGARERLASARRRFAALSVWNEEGLEAATRECAEELGVKAGEIIHPVRVAVSGKSVGPGLFETLATLGRDSCLRRIDRALEMCA